jgi:hypothetical protein
MKGVKTFIVSRFRACSKKREVMHTQKLTCMLFHGEGSRSIQSLNLSEATLTTLSTLLINMGYLRLLFLLEIREYGRRDQSRWPRGTIYPQKLALTSPTRGGRYSWLADSGHGVFFKFKVTILGLQRRKSCGTSPPNTYDLQSSGEINTHDKHFGLGTVSSEVDSSSTISPAIHGTVSLCDFRIALTETIINFLMQLVIIVISSHFSQESIQQQYVQMFGKKHSQ